MRRNVIPTRLPRLRFGHGGGFSIGVGFAGREQLVAQLAQAVPWGSAGRKYQLDAVDYPGLNALLDRLPNGRADTDQT